MKILFAGGLGYIGSHTAVEVLNAGHDVVIVDNLSNSKIGVLDKIKQITGKDVKFYKTDVCEKFLKRILTFMQLSILLDIKQLESHASNL